uniref:F-box domain-containing protein n=1 Tax=Arundo donax TaxID=35708 RepID=A0A0A8YGA9_ARUDO
MEAPRAAGGEDLISYLPVEILSEIIARLTTAEAGRTAVLSTL